ncbi:MAG: hypothetical protein KDB80_17855 [Planctomycetes bacterium]|nr:hypothetical protein [Planctomycetota bacterium]
MTTDQRTRRWRFVSEGTVIVVSILLAFGIDALWARHLLREEEAAALAALDTEFRANLEQIDRVVDYHKVARQRIATLVDSSPEAIRALSQTATSEIMSATANPWTFDAVLGTTKALVGAGKLVVLQDPRLRNALTTFANLVSDADEDGTYMQSNAYDVWRAECRHGGPWTDAATEVGITGPIRGLDFIPKATPTDLLNIRADREFMGLVHRFHLNAAYYVAELGRLRAQATVVLELIAESD